MGLMNPHSRRVAFNPEGDTASSPARTPGAPSTPKQVRFTDEEYEENLVDAQWSKGDTLLLFEYASTHSLNWEIIAKSQFEISHTAEECRKRYEFIKVNSQMCNADSVEKMNKTSVGRSPFVTPRKQRLGLPPRPPVSSLANKLEKESVPKPEASPAPVSGLKPSGMTERQMLALALKESSSPSPETTPTVISSPAKDAVVTTGTGVPLPRPAEYSSWSEAKRTAWDSAATNPNAYYYRHTSPGETQNSGKWNSEEHNAFMEALEAFPPQNGQWGLFSTRVPGRVGYQCRNYYHLLLKEGKLSDADYQDPTGSYSAKKVKRDAADDVSDATPPSHKSASMATAAQERDPRQLFKPINEQDASVTVSRVGSKRLASDTEDDSEDIESELDTDLDLEELDTWKDSWTEYEYVDGRPSICNMAIDPVVVAKKRVHMERTQFLEEERVKIRNLTEASRMDIHMPTVAPKLYHYPRPKKAPRRPGGESNVEDGSVKYKIVDPPSHPTLWNLVPQIRPEVLVDTRADDAGKESIKLDEILKQQKIDRLRLEASFNVDHQRLNDMFDAEVMRMDDEDMTLTNILNKFKIIVSDVISRHNLEADSLHASHRMQLNYYNSQPVCSLVPVRVATGYKEDLAARAEEKLRFH